MRDGSRDENDCIWWLTAREWECRRQVIYIQQWDVGEWLIGRVARHIKVYYKYIILLSIYILTTYIKYKIYALRDKSHTGPQSSFADRPVWHCHIRSNASPRLLKSLQRCHLFNTIYDICDTQENERRLDDDMKLFHRDRKHFLVGQ